MTEHTATPCCSDAQEIANYHKLCPKLIANQEGYKGVVKALENYKIECEAPIADYTMKAVRRHELWDALSLARKKA